MDFWWLCRDFLLSLGLPEGESDDLLRGFLLRQQKSRERRERRGWGLGCRWTILLERGSKRRVLLESVRRVVEVDAL
jgi:hypothetical protein